MRLAGLSEGVDPAARRSALPIARRTRGFVALLLLIGMAAHFGFGLHTLKPPKIVFGDGIDYLNGAYHLRHDLTFTESADEVGAPPAIGREPGYSVFLALLMGLDPALGGYKPSCAGIEGACDPARFLGLSVANLVLMEAASLIVFALATGLSGSAVTGLAAAGYILLNVNLMRSHWYDPMSDSVALALVALAMLALQRAWGRAAPLRWCGVGLSLAALTLTKAVFLPFSLAIAAIALGPATVRTSPARTLWRMPLVAAAVYAAVVGGWAVRNWSVSGSVRLTDDRGGIALSTREVFDHMTPAQIAAAVVFWTPGGGSELARRMFSPETVAPFELYAPGGFYDRGQNGYGRRVEALMHSDGIGAWQARAVIDRRILGEILASPIGYAVATLPLLYRGLWFDQFALVSLPLLVWIFMRALRRGDHLLSLLLGFGLFNELFYALFSLNIPRYQVTAMPALALASALGLSAALRWAARNRSAGRDREPAGGPRALSPTASEPGSAV